MRHAKGVDGGIGAGGLLRWLPAAEPAPPPKITPDMLSPLVPAKDQLALLASTDAKLARNKKHVFDFWRIVYEGGHMERAPEFMTAEYLAAQPERALGARLVRAHDWLYAQGARDCAADPGAGDNRSRPSATW